MNSVQIGDLEALPVARFVSGNIMHAFQI